MRATDDTGTSDPFLKFKLRGDKKAKLRNWYKKGGLFGRSTKTDVQINTLNPTFAQAKRPLFFYGTRPDREPIPSAMMTCPYAFDAIPLNTHLAFDHV